MEILRACKKKTLPSPNSGALNQKNIGICQYSQIPIWYLDSGNILGTLNYSGPLYPIGTMKVNDRSRWGYIPVLQGSGFEGEVPIFFVPAGVSYQNDFKILDQEAQFYGTQRGCPHSLLKPMVGMVVPVVEIYHWFQIGESPMLHSVGMGKSWFKRERHQIFCIAAGTYLQTTPPPQVLD